MDLRKRQMFGTTREGQPVFLYRIANAGMEAVLTEYGACLVSLLVPDCTGGIRDVVLGYDCLSQYEKGTAVFGATVGRVANRIAGASFELGGKTFRLDRNEGENCNHSGFCGFHRRVWRVNSLSAAGIEFFLESPDGDQGFPGNLRLSVCYSLTDDGALQIRYRAVSDADTLLNVTNHSYFNLDGQGSGDIMDHRLQIFADRYMPIRGEDSIPEKTPAGTAGTAFDFSAPARIGDHMDSADPQLAFTHGYNHHFIIADRKGKPARAACLYAPRSGICMEVETDLPGIQVYTGYYLEEEPGKADARYMPYGGLALETQYVPDSIHIPGAQPCILKAGEEWASVTRYCFRREDVQVQG